MFVALLAAAEFFHSESDVNSIGCLEGTGRKIHRLKLLLL